MGYVEWSIQFTTDLLAVIGYLGFVLLMTMESLSLPIPSEIVIPLGGYLAYTGNYNLFIIVLACTIGSVIGAVMTYWISRYGGRPFINRYGKWLFITPKNLKNAEKWFDRYGAKAICFTRMFPVIRTFISVPAGLTKYNQRRFVILSAIGSFVWCLILATIGFALGPQWQAVRASFDYFEIVIVLGLAALLAWWVYKKYVARKQQNLQIIEH